MYIFLYQTIYDFQFDFEVTKKSIYNKKSTFQPMVLFNYSFVNTLLYTFILFFKCTFKSFSELYLIM